MKGQEQMIEYASGCTDPDKLRAIIRNAGKSGAMPLAEVAFRKLISILPAEKPGTVEHDFWQTVHAFEHLLTEERGKTTRLTRTRQKVARVGVQQTLCDWAVSDKATDGFSMLLERHMPELTGEAIVLRHGTEFSAAVIAAARKRLEGAGVDIATLPSESGE